MRRTSAATSSRRGRGEAREYYGLQYSRRLPSGSPAESSDRGDDDNAMTRSEEELQVGDSRVRRLLRAWFV